MEAMGARTTAGPVIVDANGSWQSVFGAVAPTIEARLGTLPFRCRYHPPGTRFEDDYQVTGHSLRSGSSCEDVLLAVSQFGSATGAKRKYVVKRIELDGVSPARLAQLRSEVKVFLCADHPSISQLHDVYESEHYVHMVSENFEGGELLDRVIQQQGFPDNQASSVVRQVLSAVSFLHGIAAAHRRLRPENIFFDRECGHVVKITDFGLSAFLFDVALWGREHEETADCIAPEILRTADSCESCDLWSVGVIAFFVTCGEMPFRLPCVNLLEQADGNVRRRIMSGSYTLQPSISTPARSLIKVLLHIMPGKRLTVHQALAHPWLVNCRDAPAKDVPFSVLAALRSFPLMPKFKRSCLLVLAWSVTREEHDSYRDMFLSLASKGGVITMAGLQRAFTNAGFPDCASKDVVSAFTKAKGIQEEDLDDGFCCSARSGDTGARRPQIQYSDFLAAMLSSELQLDDDLLRSAFRRFDYAGTGNATPSCFRRIFGHSGSPTARDADLLSSGAVSFQQFAAYMRGQNGSGGGIPLLDPSQFEKGRSARGCCTMDVGDGCVVQ